MSNNSVLIVLFQTCTMLKILPFIQPQIVSHHMWLPQSHLNINSDLRTKRLFLSAAISVAVYLTRCDDTHIPSIVIYHHAGDLIYSVDVHLRDLT